MSWWWYFSTVQPHQLSLFFPLLQMWWSFIVSLGVSRTCSLTAMTTEVRSLSSSFSMISFFRVKLKSLEETNKDTKSRFNIHWPCGISAYVLSTSKMTNMSREMNLFAGSPYTVSSEWKKTNKKNCLDAHLSACVNLCVMLLNVRNVRTRRVIRIISTPSYFYGGILWWKACYFHSSV